MSWGQKNYRCVANEEEKGRRGEGEKGRRGEGEKGRRGEGEKGRRGEGEKGRRGEGEKGRRGEGEKGRRGEGEKGRRGYALTPDGCFWTVSHDCSSSLMSLIPSEASSHPKVERGCTPFSFISA